MRIYFIKLFFSIRIFFGFLATVVDVECMYKDNDEQCHYKQEREREKLDECKEEEKKTCHYFE